MRWKSNIISINENNDERIVVKFLLIPRKLNSFTWRWLEYVLIKEKKSYIEASDGDYMYCWREIEFYDTEVKRGG